MGRNMHKVPEGTAERFFRPLRDFVHRGRAVPNAEALGYFQGFPDSLGAFSNNRIGTVQSMNPHRQMALRVSKEEADWGHWRSQWRPVSGRAGILPAVPGI